ncbi:hypothetical protein ACEWY4_016361 [Coilia grayii]|uniref:Adhesion G-protein coupled receptor G7-like n=1 Tax=Coilia grayii TaxID=363190 RepID=A0ABD1JK44_9TELE
MYKIKYSFLFMHLCTPVYVTALFTATAQTNNSAVPATPGPTTLAATTAPPSTTVTSNHLPTTPAPITTTSTLAKTPAPTSLTTTAAPTTVTTLLPSTPAPATTIATIPAPTTVTSTPPSTTTPAPTTVTSTPPSTTTPAPITVTTTLAPTTVTTTLPSTPAPTTIIATAPEPTTVTTTTSSETVTTPSTTPAPTTTIATTPEPTIVTTPPSTTPTTTTPPTTPAPATTLATTLATTTATTTPPSTTPTTTTPPTTPAPTTTIATTPEPTTVTTTPPSTTVTTTTPPTTPAPTTTIATTPAPTTAATTTPSATPTTTVPTTPAPTTTTSTLGTTTPLSTITTSSTPASTPSTTPPALKTTTPILVTAAPSPTNPTTPAPLTCINGGELQNGVCICPDEWTGDTCSIANYCNETQLAGFNFPRTVIGWSAYSSELCLDGTTNAGISIASTRCVYQNGKPMFGHIEKVECGLTLENIQANVTVSMDPTKVQQLASSAQILTSRPEQLTGSNITSAADIVNTILSNRVNITEDTAVAAVTTVSQLLTANPQRFTEESNATVSLTRTLERFSVSQRNDASLVVQPRLAIQTIQVQRDQTTGIQFSALSGLSTNFTTNRIQLKTNVSEIKDTRVPSDVQIFIKLPSDQSRKTSKVSVGFVLYENDLFFRSRVFQPSLNIRRMVISGSLGGVKAEHVKLRFLPMNVSEKLLHDFACVFWNYSLNDWSTRGCSKTNLSTGRLQCQCNHTTNFAVLMSFRISYQFAQPLSDISIVGCSLSIVGLILTIIFQIITRKSRRSAPTILLVSICVSMTIFYFLFLFGIENPDRSLSRKSTVSKENILLSSDLHHEPDRGPCTALTALMQYFLLATFTWNTLYAVHIYILIRKTLSGPPSGFMAVSVVIGWGFPAGVVAITLGVTYRVDDPLGYRREEFCWLAALNQDEQFDFAKPMFWGFLLPVSLMLLCNTAVLMYFGINTCKTDPLLTSTKNISLRKQFMSCFSLGALLGITWVLGYLVLSTSDPTLSNIFSILFCVCNTTQGIQIFILFMVRTADFRKMIQSVTESMSAPEMSLHRQMYVLWKPKSHSQDSSKTADAEQSNGNYTQSQTTLNL